MTAALNGFFINLDRSVERRRHMEAELRRLNIDWIDRFSAIDGKTLTPSADCRVSPGELACFLTATENHPAPVAGISGPLRISLTGVATP